MNKMEIMKQLQLSVVARSAQEWSYGSEWLRQCTGGHSGWRGGVQGTDF